MRISYLVVIDKNIYMTAKRFFLVMLYSNVILNDWIGPRFYQDILQPRYQELV